MPEELIPQLIYFAMLKHWDEQWDNRGGSSFPKKTEDLAGSTFENRPILRCGWTAKAHEWKKIKRIVGSWRGLLFS